jgi:hypothetical protein
MLIHTYYTRALIDPTIHPRHVIVLAHGKEGVEASVTLNGKPIAPFRTTELAVPGSRVFEYILGLPGTDIAPAQNHTVLTRDFVLPEEKTVQETATFVVRSATRLGPDVMEHTFVGNIPFHHLDVAGCRMRAVFGGSYDLTLGSQADLARAFGVPSPRTEAAAKKRQERIDNFDLRETRTPFVELPYLDWAELSGPVPTWNDRGEG